MTDPYLMRNLMYLRELEATVASRKKHDQPKDSFQDTKFHLRAIAVLLVVGLAMVIDPLGI